MLSTFPTLLPFLLFAFVASITPGPTNILVLTNSARFGGIAALPIIFGACMSAAMIVFVVGCGFGRAIVGLPMLQTTMQWIGIFWLSYMACQIYRSPVQVIRSSATVDEYVKLSAWSAGALQLINPKTWMMALAVSSVFADSENNRIAQVVVLSIAFFLISLPCLGAWALLGSLSNRFLLSTHAMKRFNQTMAIALLVAAWSVAWL